MPHSNNTTAIIAWRRLIHDEGFEEDDFLECIARLKGDLKQKLAKLKENRLTRAFEMVDLEVNADGEPVVVPEGPNFGKFIIQVSVTIP